MAYSSIGVKLVSKGVEPEVDIIAVHGLKGDAFKTWTHKSTEPDGEDVFWLKDMLPEEVPNARILAYGYDADPSKMFESTSANMVHHHATTLVSELHFYRRRQNERRRPIIFICHSLGGIVVKRALIYSSSCNLSHNSHLRSIKVSTYGIFFLGTPHMGADLARWGKMAEMLVRMVSSKSWIDSNSALITALEKNSETLQNITDGFLGISRDFRMFFFWEELKTSIPGMGPNLIVEYASAVPEALPDAGRAAIHATHTEMCKFRDEDSPGWNVLAGCLCDFVQLAPQAIEMNWAQEERRNLQARRDLVSNIIQQDIHDSGLSPQPIMSMAGRRSPDAGAVRAIMAEDTPGPTMLAIKDTPFVKPLSLQENKYFEGREEALLKLHSILQSPIQGAVTISGLSGAGKTHLAREYFFHRKGDYPGGAFWIDCKPMIRTLSTECLDLGFCMIAEELGLLGENGGNNSRVNLNNDPKTTTRLRVLEWFQRHDSWLLVLDGANAETNNEVNLLAEYIPKSKAGSIILTTLNSSFAGSARLGAPEKLELDPVTDGEAVRMLLHYAQIRNPSDTELVAAGRLVVHLGHIPLTIHSAGSYIKGKKVSISDYLKKYEKRPFVDREDLEPFHIIFDRLEERSDRYQEARNLLCLLAFLHREIPVQMLVTGIRRLPSNIKLVAKDGGRRDFNNTIGHLLAYSLVDRCGQQDENVQVDTLVLHSVVQDVCISRMRKKSELRKWLRRAISMFCSSFDYMELRKRSSARFLVSDYRRYELHGMRLLQHARKREVDTEELVRVLGDIKIAINDDQAGVRYSMFRSGSTSDSAPETPSPESSRRATWEDDPIHDEPDTIQDYEERQSRTPSRSRVGSRNPSATRNLGTPPFNEDNAQDSDGENYWTSKPPAPRPLTDRQYRYRRPWVPGQKHVQLPTKPLDSQVTEETVIFNPAPLPASAPVTAMQSPTNAGMGSPSSGKRGMLSYIQSIITKWGLASAVPTIARPQWPNSPTIQEPPHSATFPSNSPATAGYGSPRPYPRGKPQPSDLDHLHNSHRQPLHYQSTGHGHSQSLTLKHLSHPNSLPARFGNGSADFDLYDHHPQTPLNYPGEGGYLNMPVATPRPFSPGYSPSWDTDLSSSPIARSIVGPRYRSSSLAWSEPIVESHDKNYSPSPGGVSSAGMVRGRSGGKSPRITALQAESPRPLDYSSTPMSRVVSEPTRLSCSTAGAGSPGLGIGGMHIPFDQIPRVTIAPNTPDTGFLEGGYFFEEPVGRRRSAPEGPGVGLVGAEEMVRSRSEPEETRRTQVGMESDREERVQLDTKDMAEID